MKLSLVQFILAILLLSAGAFSAAAAETAVDTLSGETGFKYSLAADAEAEDAAEAEADSKVYGQPLPCGLVLLVAAGFMAKLVRRGKAKKVLKRLADGCVNGDYFAEIAAKFCAGMVSVLGILLFIINQNRGICESDCGLLYLRQSALRL